MRDALTQAELKSVLAYDPDTGRFTWVSKVNNFEAGSIAGGPNWHGYLRIKICQTSYQSHRLAFLYMTGAFPVDQVDHINGIRDDNRWLNLRQSTPLMNMKNRRLFRNSTSGTPGVYFHRGARKWMAHIGVGRAQVHLGSFSDKSDAVHARHVAEKEYGFHENHGRVSTGRAGILKGESPCK